MSQIFKICINKVLETSGKLQIRHYSRWSHRKPTQTIFSENSQERSHKIKNVQKHKNECLINLNELDAVSEHVMHLKKGAKKGTVPKKIVTDMLETIIDLDGNIVYTKMKDNDPRVGSLLVLIKSKKVKEKKDLILLEGKRLIKDALQSNCKLEHMIFSRLNEIEYLKPYLPKFGSKIYKMPYREMQLWSDLTTSPGIMGIFQTPDLTSYKPKNSIPLIVICDKIQEPGNVGSVLRSSAGVGCEKVLLTRGCANVWDSKVTRSSSGAHFHLQIHQKQDFSNLHEITNKSLQVFIADNKIVRDNDNISEAYSKDEIAQVLQSLPIIPYYEVNFSASKPIVLIVGGETEGISLDAYKFAAEHNGVRLNIPLENDIDSLNTSTALSIIMFEIKKQILLANISKIRNVGSTCT